MKLVKYTYRCEVIRRFKTTKITAHLTLPRFPLASKFESSLSLVDWK